MLNFGKRASALRPNIGPPDARVFRLDHDGGLRPVLGLALMGRPALEAVLARIQMAAKWIAFMAAAALAAPDDPLWLHAAVVTYGSFGGNEAMK